ncbi:superoxide dismutase, iron/manganese-containing [Citrifermentans bemidjiense Bem]|uniref:superoxide dismutase n=1 Tax=Citrifermentans bemidjiense (strain ATCC BAA-1014 / DSM 16622 / JCM 12645 / Bem) TaxID=404380 RepID=B5EE71_CITBB|nr:Fe-Mn family superoxide dismutase [Citrifermentans bemidjiense]ACH39216.1 superoxide dismutase, iron/manganese-containing [Citrifermentans bemidjiense Bem]
MTAFTAKDYSRLIGMPGFSETLLNNHFTLYQGYVKNTNTLDDALTELRKSGKGSDPGFAELKRRFGWEFNGMRLHEYYFENLGGNQPINQDGRLASRIHQDFGGFDEWVQDFKSVGAMRGIGWAIMYQDLSNGRLLNFWINEHDAGHPAGCTPVLIMDVFEHAFMTDYGLKRADYINAFFQNIDWNSAEQRLQM